MTLTTTNTQSLIANSYQEAKSQQEQLIWQKLDSVTVNDAAALWLSTLSPNTRINYQSGLRKLAELGLLSPLMTLQSFALVNHEAIIDQIKLVHEWTECSQQSRAAC